MPLGPELVLAHRVKVKDCKGKNEKEVKNERIKYVASLAPKISIPVIIAILNEINTTLTTDAPVIGAGSNNNNVQAVPPHQAHGLSEEQLQQTFKVINKAKEVFEESDRNQNAGLTELPGILSKFTKEYIENNLKVLIDSIEHIHVTPTTYAAWEEAMIWLDGLFRHTFDMTKKDSQGQPQKEKDGTYKTIDWEDKLFKGKVKLTKLDVANYYHAAAVGIEERLNVHVKLKAVPLGGQRVELDSQPGLHIVEDEMVVLLESVDNHGVFRVALPEGYDKALLQRITDAIKTAILNPNAVVMVPPEPVEEKMEGDLASLLNAAVDDDDLDFKFVVLQAGIERFGFTETQSEMLKTFKTNIIGQMHSYMNNCYIRKRAHHDLAEDVINQLSPMQEPIDFFKPLFELLPELTGKNSDDLLSKVQNLLLSAYKVLCRVGHQPMNTVSMPVLMGMKK